MDRTEVLQKITVIMRDLTDDDSLQLTENSSPDDVVMWDSVLHINLLTAIEADFQIRFETSEIGITANIGELADLIMKKLKA